MAVANPIAFRPFAVTFWTTVIYVAILVPLIIVHETVPPAPTDPTLYSGLNLTKSWLDLTVLTRSYHPYNSRANDDVHDWLLLQLEDIKRRNSASNSDMVVTEDMVSNVTTLGVFWGAPAPVATYFEGTNIIVYIRGSEDPPGRWWEKAGSSKAHADDQGGVLVNAHYDSVSTSYGATDDGMGVVTLMALVEYFSHPEHRPKKGIVALFNNAEEGGLWGAKAFAQSPFMPFCHTFLNLEGAGAGGRAILFRTTDAEVTNAYRGSPNPFGTVITSDAFSLGTIRSNTDYIVFNGVYGIRGLDLAFYRPRARYHTNQDDARHASKGSLWHMLSSSLHTVAHLSGDTGRTFTGERGDRDSSKVPNGKGNVGVWFDIFAQSFALFELRSLFAWSLTLLIASPLILFGLTYLLVRNDKYYLFSAKTSAYEGAVFDPVSLGGWKGFMRYPFALVVTAALVVGSAYLITKINPLIIYSSEYTVWAMMLSLFYFVFWTIMASANFARPSALHRIYSILWMYLIGWVALVVDTVLEDRFHIAAGYILVFFQSGVFLAFFIALCELFGLPNKFSYGRQVHDEHDAADHGSQHAREHFEAVPHLDGQDEPADEQAVVDGADDDEAEPSATETTPLVGGSSKSGGKTTFATRYRRSISAFMDTSRRPSPVGKREAYDFEQPWSSSLPSWLWILEFLIVGPFFIILIGQNGLTLVSAISQTGADGSSLLFPYLVVALFSISMLLPITPFMHRITHHVPNFLLVVFVATLIYNLVAFPFSDANRYKMYFQQTVDLDTGASQVSYAGIQEYVEKAVAALPSAMGKELHCGSSGSIAKAGLTTCSYDGSDVLPNVVKAVPDGVPPEKGFHSWITYNITRAKGKTNATFVIDARETKLCAIAFDKPISSFRVVGGNEADKRFDGGLPSDGGGGLTKIQLYRRDWSTPWKVQVQWEKSDDSRATGIDGRVLCSWEDANRAGALPALDEGLKYLPTWAALTKMAEGLCEGSKVFKA